MIHSLYLFANESKVRVRDRGTTKDEEVDKEMDDEYCN